jgi:hypothetical protein
MRLATALLAATIAIAVPATAQAEPSPSTALSAEPIDPARLKSAEAIAAQILPDGTYAKVMSASMDGMMKPMLDMVGKMPLSQLAALGGLSDEEAAQLGEGTIKELNAIIDPLFEQRMRLITDSTVRSMSKLMTTMEPGLREGLSRAFARRYSAEQLADITRFFETPTGRTYAADSMMIFTDPEVMTKMMEMLPKMMEQMPAMVKDMEAEMASLPKIREWGDLSSDEKAKVAKLLGTTVAEIEERQKIEVEENTDAAI